MDNVQEKTISQILNEIKLGKPSLDSEYKRLSLTDLLSKDENGITYLEYACDNHIGLPYNLEHEICKNPLAIYLCIKKKYTNYLFYINDENLLLTKVNDNETLIEYTIKNCDSIYSIVKVFKENYIIIDYIMQYCPNNAYCLSSDIITKLFKNPEGIQYIEKYKNNDDFVRNVFQKAEPALIIEFVKRNNMFEYLKYGTEELLLAEYEPGVTCYEVLLKNGIEPIFAFPSLKEKSSMEILLKCNRPDLLYNASKKLLLEKMDENITYLEYLIKLQKNGINVHLEKINYDYFFQNLDDLASILIILAENDMIGYVPELPKEMLLYKTDSSPLTVLERLIEKNKDITVNKIIPNSFDKKDLEISIILRAAGIDTVQSEYDKQGISLADEKTKEFNEAQEIKPTEYEPLLIELRDMLYKDGISDKVLVDAVITSYRLLLSQNNSAGLQELKQLIEIKKANPQLLCYKREKKGAYFSSKDKSVHLDNEVISTINHETSHALHHFLANEETPNNYNEVIERARTNPKTIIAVQEYAKKFTELRKQIIQSTSEEEIEEFYKKNFSPEAILDLSNFLRKSKEDKKNELMKDYPLEVLDTILAKTYSVDEFLEQRKKIEKMEIVDITMRNEYPALCAIGDIIDAIFKGKLRNGILRGNDGQNIPTAYGHGIYYYNMVNHGFDEMIANYGEILKSPNADAMFEYLRTIVGDEVVDMINDFYKTRILQSSTYIKENGIDEEVAYAR